MQTLGEEINDTLKAALQTEDPGGELAQKACGLHKQWLMCTWEKYSPQAHKGLSQLYVCDPRFTAYYEKNGQGCTEFLRDAIHIFCNDAE